MAEEDQILVVITTCPDRSTAQQLASALVENRLAACVQLDEISSCYRWDGAVTHDPEVRLMIKTTASAYPRLEVFVSGNHPYELPELAAFPAGGSAAYSRWVHEQTAPAAG